ncbi:MAG: C69 family dipeptidase [Chloroflexota bacterium]
MCDTAVALGNATANGSVIFAKNSDRSPNECQPLCHVPRLAHEAGATVRCQYREVPQVAQTWEVIGARPWWLWGFETGVNEWGVAIGNEAVFSKEPYAETGLLGMDLLRLGLERGRTAHEAMHAVIDLLERHGQGGSAEHGGVRYYHNSFIIADPREAWVLETAGRYWAAQRVRGARAISNVYTIETDWDEASPDLVAHAVAQGWCRKEDFNFARAYGDFSREYAPRCFRYQRAQSLLAGQRGRITVETMMAHLRDHYEGTFAASPWAPQELFFSSICMHSSRQYPGETASSIVAELREGEGMPPTLLWHSFTSPCLSAFHPCYLGGAGLPAVLDAGNDRFDAASPWWLFERLQRRVDANLCLAPALQTIWRPLERRWLDRVPALEKEAMNLQAQGRQAAATALLRGAVDETAEELLTAARRAEEVLDQAEALVGKGIELQPEHHAVLNAEAGLQV